MTPKLLITDIDYKSINDFVIETGSVYTVMFGVVYMTFIILIYRDWENNSI